MNLTERTESDEPILNFSPLALKDIKGTWQYVSEQSHETAAKLIRSISEKCVFLSQNPKTGRERNELIVGLRQFPFKNYNIFYFQIESGIEIHRVLHSSRDVIQVFDDAIDSIK